MKISRHSIKRSMDCDFRGGQTVAPNIYGPGSSRGFTDTMSLSIYNGITMACQHIIYSNVVSRQADETYSCWGRKASLKPVAETRNSRGLNVRHCVTLS